VSVFDIRDRLRPRLAPVPTPVPVRGVVDQAPISGFAPDAKISTPAFVVEDQESGRVVLTMPAETAALSAEDFLLRLSGRLVEAEKANGNGAFWSQGDLEFGLPTVAYGPLNWLHDERKVVGVLTDARLVTKEAAAAASLSLNAHVVADATMWRWLYPSECREVARHSAERALWYSMECISREVACVGERGCGRSVDYLDALNRTTACCDHLRERSAERRFVDPIFQGAAVIVPPVRPGWRDASLGVQRAAASLVEDQHIDVPGLTTADAEAMVAQVMQWANR
jgi:hypothetical protein